jgi:hypothetical protein
MTKLPGKSLGARSSRNLQENAEICKISEKL